jgi:hypothetical protein
MGALADIATELNITSSPGSVDELENLLTSILEYGVALQIDESDCQIIRQYGP